MGSAKRNLLTSILLLVVMGIFAVLTIFIVVDAINKKYYNDIKVEYEVQEESPNVILTFARNEGSKFSTDNTKVVLNEDKTKFRIDGTVPTIEDGVVTNLDDLTSSDGREFYFFSTNSSFIDPQEDPENPDFIFSDTDSRYYVSTEDNPIWYDVPKSSENLTLYSVFLTPNVHNSDFANAPFLSTSPNVIISHDVVDIPYNAFSDISPAMMGGEPNIAKIESVVIPNSVESINSEVNYESRIVSGAFAACTTLTNIIIPGSVEYVGGEAFIACTGLDTVKYGNGYYLPTEDTQHAILVDTNLKADNVTIHADCISIQGGTFSKYVLLGLITPGEGAVDYINMNLQEIAIPKNVKNIGFGAFMMCMGLENVVFEDNSDLTSIGMYSFTGCSRLRTINLEDTKLEEIGVLAFASMDESMPMLIEEITLPSTLKTIGMMAFYGCSSLSKINIQIESIESYLENLPKEVDMEDPTTYPIIMQIISSLQSSGLNELLSISLNQNGQDVTNIEIPDNITEIPMYAFAGLNIKSVNISSSVTSIGERAFADCSSLESFTFKEGSKLESLGEGVIDGCASLRNIIIEVESLEAYIEDPLINVFITVISAADLEIIPEISLYENGEHITEIEVPGTIATIPDYLFAYLDIESIVIPNSVTSIGEWVFYNCRSLETVNFGDNSILTSIGDYAFRDCSSLTSITIPDSVTSIGVSAFYGCSSLTIYCEASSQPSGWSSSWNNSNRPVYWAGEWKMVDGVPKPIESGVEGVGYSDVGEDFGIGFDGLGFREELYFNDKRERKVV